MPFLNGFPYSDYDQINLDWVIKTCKEALDKALEAMGVAGDTKTFVEDYFANLDVQQEINNKLDQMADDGELLTVIADTVADAADAWLALNITNPSSPPLDRSLSLSNAAAPADLTGYYIDAIRGQIRAALVPELKTWTSNWFQGTINYSDGAIDANYSNRVRSGIILTFSSAAPVELTFYIPAGWKMGYREYNADGTYTGNYGEQLFFETSMTVLKIAGHKYGFVLAKTDNSNFTPSDVPAGLITYTQYAYTDTSLTLAGKSADAAVVGEIVTGHSEGLEMLIKACAAPPKQFSSWFQGSINTDGTNLASSRKVRSGGFENYDGADYVWIEVPAGLQIKGRVYTANTGAQQASSYIGDVPADNRWVTGHLLFTPTDGYYYRFIVGFTDDSVISPSEPLLADILVYVGNEQMQSSIIQSYADGTLLGNICIRGAKITNFNDGTPPVTEWYLLMDCYNNFYRSKDLVNKDFLFQFVPPSAEVRDWSNGIDAHNNIFFFKDAAAYENENGGQPRLDDAKRVNPVYYMAADNYSAMHELDFGSSFKPAGFIPNGWCVLPNNDILMCEYTRGTLKTTNVWHVDGTDATDPNNWTRTWTHDIEDTLNIGNSIKHCHFVTYDFYCGVCYFGTGDSDNGSWIFHSTDGGQTWTMTYGPDRRTCRLINLIFTEDHIYSASDDPTYKSFFITDRDANNIMDLANAVSIDLNAGRDAAFLARHQACYGCVLVQDVGLILMLDRCDNTVPSPVTISGYDLVTGTVKDIVTLPPVSGSAVGHVGFKCKHFDKYPTGNQVNTGFSPKPRSTNPDTNTIGVCGNKGGTTGSGFTRINNLQLYLYRDAAGTYSMRVGTLYI